MDIHIPGSLPEVVKTALAVAVGPLAVLLQQVIEDPTMLADPVKLKANILKALALGVVSGVLYLLKPSKPVISPPPTPPEVK